MKPTIQCPAAQERHPVLSPHKLDVECRLAGFMQPARRRSGELVVCCDQYSTCRIWMTHIEVTRHGPSTKAQRDQAGVTRRARDTLE